jgi:hypothetical protein
MSNAKAQNPNKPQPNIFEIFHHPSPLPSEEREGVRGPVLNVRRKFSNLTM